MPFTKSMIPDITPAPEATANVNPDAIASFMSYYSNGGAAELSSIYQSAMNALPTEVQQSISSEVAKFSQSVAAAGGQNSAAAGQPVAGVAVAVSAVLVAAAGLLM